MAKAEALKKNHEFRRAYNRGVSVPGSCVVLYAVKTKGTETRLGLTVSKKIGGAVQRNRAKRVMRVAFASVLPRLKGGLDVVLVARTRCVFVKSQEVTRQLLEQCQKANLLQ